MISLSNKAINEASMHYIGIRQEMYRKWSGKRAAIETGYRYMQEGI